LHFHPSESLCLPSRRTDHSFARQLRFPCFAVLAALCVIAPNYARSQEAVALPAVKMAAQTETPVNFESTSVGPVPADTISLPAMEAMSARGDQKPAKGPVESEIILEGLVSYGNYKIFASGYDEKLFTGGVEYDRHSWGHFLGAQMDYVAEFLPFVLLDKPLHIDIYGNPSPQSEKNIRQYVPGIGLSPIGFRWQWLSKRAIKPYLEAKAGVIAFTQKVPSTEAAYENFSLQSATGVQVRMTERWGLRLGLFSDFHFSNGFVVPINPGLDVMNANLGISYHLGHQAQ
jgi:hypothetical protein